MLIYFLLLYCAIVFNPEVSATGEHDIKRGDFPFMAYLYYPDDKVFDASGIRFLRGAVLIHQSWLISASIEAISEVHVGFPRKTLLARVGATHIDANFTLNEDEDEQEREIILIVRPKNYKKSEWWLTDINLLKTLLPFNLTNTVAITPFRSRPEVMKKCSILVYSPPYNKSSDKILMRLHVELQFSRDICGSYFNADKMICAGENEKITQALSDTRFCEGNRGSPLICDDHVVGLQTYVEDCKPPFLYNLFIAWDNFTSCAMEEKYAEEKCVNVVTPIYKDEESQKVSPKKAAVHTVSSYFIDTDEGKNYTSTTLLSNMTTNYTGLPLSMTKTTRVMPIEDEEDATTTLSSVTTENSDVEIGNITANNTTNVTRIDDSNTIPTTKGNLFPGYFLHANFTEYDNVSTVSSTVTTTTTTTQRNTNHSSEATTDMTAEAAQEPTETYIIEPVRPDRIQGRIDIFNESTIRTYTKYEPNPEPMTSRVHNYVEEDSNESESVDIGVSVTPRKPYTVSTQHSMMSPKPVHGNASEVNRTENVTETGSASTETFWPIQKIATPSQIGNNKENNIKTERQAKVELQQHRARGKKYRSAANSNQLQFAIMLFNVFALKFL